MEAHLDTYTSREQKMFCTKFLSQDEPKLEEGEIEIERKRGIIFRLRLIKYQDLHLVDIDVNQVGTTHGIVLSKWQIDY